MMVLCSEEHFLELEQTVNDSYLIDEDGTGAVWAALRWTRDKKGRWRKSRKARKLTPFYALSVLRGHEFALPPGLRIDRTPNPWWTSGVGDVDPDR